VPIGLLARFPRRVDPMLQTSGKKFFLYGLSIAASEEFLTQGVLQGSYFLWVFTLIPFALFLLAASCLRNTIHRRLTGWIAPAVYYVFTGALGLSVEWFIIGLSPWRDTTSPLLLIILFHAGMFSFWGTVAFGPYLLLDDRQVTVKIQRSFVSLFVVLMAIAYALTLAAKLSHASGNVQFLATIGPVILSFLSMNGVYLWYFYTCGPIQLKSHA
jgi:hypothetical protein